MLRRDEPAFERLVDRALIDMFQSGEIRRIYAALVRHEGPHGPDEPVPEGSVRRSEHVSGLALGS